MTVLLEQLKVKDEQIRARDVQISQLVYELGELRQHLALPALGSTKKRGWWRRLFSAA